MMPDPTPPTLGPGDAAPEGLALGATVDALRHLGVVLATLLGLFVLSYVVPAFERFRPWQPGDALPLASLVTPAEALYAFAGTGSLGGEPASAEVLGGAVSQALAHHEADAPHPGPLVEVPGSLYAGIEVHLEDPEGGLEPFYDALLATARRRPEALTRVAHYGDSSIATDLFTSTLRERFQQRFGDGGHGFVLLAKGYMPYRHRGVEHDASDDWALREIVRNHDPRDRRYGYGGVQYRGRPGSWARFGTTDRGTVGHAASRFELWFQRYPRGGLVKLRVDGQEALTVNTRGPEPPAGEPRLSDDVATLQVPDGPHAFEVRFGGRGQPRLYGVVLEREGPGVVYDSLGLGGARAPRLLNYDADHIRGQLQRRGANLLVLGFGGNEASDPLTEERYEAEYGRVLERMHAGREDLGCLVLAPLDQGTRDNRGRVITLPNVPLIVRAQRRAAAAAGCAFFDTFAAMGGEGSMGRWLRANPRLAMGDLRHATPAGYAALGNLLFEAIMEGFAAYLAGLPDAARAIHTPASPSAP
ncbi:MAG: GDSL-type esterase/lipase family protein [Myxococcota bacterium]